MGKHICTKLGLFRLQIGFVVFSLVTSGSASVAHMRAAPVVTYPMQAATPQVFLLDIHSAQ
jgi:hypothetical protein